MASPFVYDEPLEPAALVDREGEVALLRERALERRNSRLEGPRRFGKTSLLRAALAAAALDGAITVEVNFLGCLTPTDVAQRIERAYASSLDGSLRRWLTAVVSTLHPTVGVAGVGIAPDAVAPALLDRLALPLEVFKRTGRPCVIAYDEFQEVLRTDAALPGVFRSELERQGEAAAYIFSGSHPGMMRELFADRRHAFFAQAAPVAVDLLPAEALVDYIGERFEQAGRDAGTALGPLLSTSEGHPQRSMLLAHHLFERTAHGEVADAEHWTDALGAARHEAAGELTIAWESASDTERRVLKIIAAQTVPLASREAANRFGLAKSGSTQATVARLSAEGTIIADERFRTGFRVVDPLFADWLRGDLPG